MNKNIPKNKVYGLIIFALSVACVAAYFGFQYAGELAYEWLNIKAQAAFSSIFDLLGMLSNTTIPTMNKAKNYWSCCDWISYYSCTAHFLWRAAFRFKTS